MRQESFSLHIEKASAEIYHSFSGIFPQKPIIQQHFMLRRILYPRSMTFASIFPKLQTGAAKPNCRCPPALRNGLQRYLADKAYLVKSYVNTFGLVK